MRITERYAATIGPVTAAAGALVAAGSFLTEGESLTLAVSVVVLLALLAATVRHAPRPLAPTLTAGAAVTLWTLPLLPSASLVERVGLAGFWLIPTLVATAVGGYPRLMEARRHRAVREARHAQQLELAHDLHDFVAHDISGIVVQAQAARYVAAADPAAAVAALERIERAGLAALESIDRTVRMLHPDPDPAHSRDALPDLAELTSLVTEFSATAPARTRIDIAPGVSDSLSREAAATAHRIAAESLTNIRRHAPQATTVDVTLAHAQDSAMVELRIRNDAGGAPLPRRDHGGRGLLALTERVRAAGGTLKAGRDQDGWQVTATFPTAS
ncbi:sensor histidine kinase [Streptomyces beijiangensis]|uniref:histidine kinase n=1 Tax=Streptomyces beijiangensis TaxID=163361 RepID=A0A939JGX9_9ACTN|nr:histidine kinase [Streptomyces beijiangensis]MBO0513873.1 two-component sensor histidine kinase [Streptomyces beijiangensis]